MFETDIFALISQSDTEKAKQNTVYIFDATRKEVVSQKSITSIISDVFFARFERKAGTPSAEKVDGVVFFGSGEVYICDPGDFNILQVIKTGANAITCHDLLQDIIDKRLAFTDQIEDKVNVVNLNKEFEQEKFMPFKEKMRPSYLSFCETV